jgi:hypothetical protein
MAGNRRRHRVVFRVKRQLMRVIRSQERDDTARRGFGMRPIACADPAGRTFFQGWHAF